MYQENSCQTLNCVVYPIYHDADSDFLKGLKRNYDTRDAPCSWYGYYLCSGL